jgi:hypothetical protein
MSTAKYEKSKKSIKLLPDETAEAKKEKKLLKEESAKRAAKKGPGGAGSMADLEAMILAKKENSFKGFMGYMEAKYGGAIDEDDEEDSGKNKRVKKVKGDQTSPQKRKKTK